MRPPPLVDTTHLPMDDDVETKTKERAGEKVGPGFSFVIFTFLT